MSSNNREHWNDAEIFWAELAPAEHLVQIYEEERVFMNALEGFVIGGIRCGDGVIVIATEDHRNELEHRLLICGIDVERGRSRGQYIDLDAEDTLSKFMIGEWPDDDLFQRTVTEIVSRARGEGRTVRAFGEMVAILWARGHNAATVRLEHLWHSLCRSEAFPLFCAYPKSGFTQTPTSSLQEICSLHSKLVAG